MRGATGLCNSPSIIQYFYPACFLSGNAFIILKAAQREPLRNPEVYGCFRASFTSLGDRRISKWPKRLYLPR